MTNYEKLTELHARKNSLLLGNVWNVSSAKMLEREGYKALGTSSAAIARSLGYEDGEKMPFDELLYLVGRIVKNVTVPVSVDIEMGYGLNVKEITSNLEKLSQTGVAGFNIEDSQIREQRRLKDAHEFADTLREIKAALNSSHSHLFMNVRTDTFLLGVPHPLEESLVRLKLYENAGADGFFVPGIVRESDISRVVQASSLPINVMCVPNLPSFGRLAELGVKRISMGNFLFENLYAMLSATVQKLIRDDSFKSIY